VNAPPIPPPQPQPAKPERRCQATSRAGQSCRAIPPMGEQYCHHHASDPGSHRDLDGQDGDQEQEQAPRRSQATLLVEAAEQVGIQLFHTDTHDAYAVVAVGEHRQTWPVKAKPFRRWLQRLYYTRHGKAPGAQAVQDAIGVLEGKALFEADQQPIAVRVAAHHGAVWLDLANERWEAVEITTGGWRVVADPPVRFRRPAGIRPLPTPEPGGSLEELRPFCNVDDDGWRLVLGFLAVSLRPVGPYPVLNLLGAQGSAKTTTAKALRNLVDPAVAGLRAEPRDEHDLAIAASNSQIVGYDNLSAIPRWLSDALCRLATGGGFATRELYTDTDEALFDFQRPVILTGIEELAVRGDLADRSLLVDLATLDDTVRRDEASFWAAYQAAQPRLLGALLNAASTALRRLPEVHLERLPRLADFAIWVVAAAPALGMDPDDFLKTYEANRTAANAMAVEALPVASVVHRFTEQHQTWTGTATQLLAALNASAPGDVDRRARTWPKTAKTLSDALRRSQPNLAKVGVQVRFSQSHHPRTIELEWIADTASRASLASPMASEQPRPRDVAGDAAAARDEAGTHSTSARDAASDPASPATTSPDLHNRSLGDPGDVGDAGTAVRSSGAALNSVDVDVADRAAPPASNGNGWRYDQPLTPCVACGTGTSNRAPCGRPLHLVCANGNTAEGHDHG
jgi:hypothetical protein